MTKTKTRSNSPAVAQEMDGPYFLKLLLYVILGTIWFNLIFSSGFKVPLPIGLIAGVLFARKDRYLVDRKIEYAVLLVAMLVGYFLPYGLYVQL